MDKLNEINTEKNNKFRNIKIDVIKGIAVFLVIWGHFIQYTTGHPYEYFENSVFKLIYSFHMPLFALISGYLFYATVQRKKLKEIIYSRIKGILIPIIIWVTINWLIYGLLKRNFNISEWFNIFTGNFLWFLWSIIAVSICLALIVKKIPKQMQLIAIIIGFFVMYIFPNSELNLFIYPFFVFGFFINKNKEKFNKYRNSKYNFLIIIIFAVLLLFFNKDCYIYNTGITIWNSKNGIIQQSIIDVYRYIIGLLGSISVVIIIDKVIGNININVKKYLIELGQYSMQIYIIQSLFFGLYLKVINRIVEYFGINILTKNMLFYNLIITPILSIIAIFMILIIIKYIEKNKKISKIVFGR